MMTFVKCCLQWWLDLCNYAQIHFPVFPVLAVWLIFINKIWNEAHLITALIFSVICAIVLHLPLLRCKSPNQDFCKSLISHCFFHFHLLSIFLPYFKSQSPVLLNISLTQAGGGDLLIRFPWLLSLQFPIIRYTTWPRRLGCRNTYCLLLTVLVLNRGEQSMRSEPRRKLKQLCYAFLPSLCVSINILPQRVFVRVKQSWYKQKV